MKLLKLPKSSSEGLVLDRNQKIPEVRQLKIKLEFKGFMLRTHLNSSARRDLTVLTYPFLSLGLIATRAWMSQTASNLVATTSEVRARKSHWLDYKGLSGKVIILF